MERLQKESAAACSKTGLHNENRPQREQSCFLLRSIFCVLSFGGGCFAAVPFILCENLRCGRPLFFGTDRFSGSNRPSAAARVQAEQLQALRTAGEDFHALFPGLHTVSYTHLDVYKRQILYQEDDELTIAQYFDFDAQVQAGGRPVSLSMRRDTLTGSFHLSSTSSARQNIHENTAKYRCV